jgi:hypothetical protein
MSKKNEINTENTTVPNENTVEFELADGTKVVMAKPTAAQIIKARRFAPDTEAIEIFLIAEVSTFDGKKRPAPELLEELPGDDYVLLEVHIKTLISPKRSSLPKIFSSSDS